MKILGLETISIAAIQPRDDNWRLHDEVQRGSLRAVLEEIGYAAPITVRKLEQGKYELIDGHLRREVMAETVTEIPAVILEATDDEARKLLATLDTIHGAGSTDRNKLKTLVESLAGSLDQNADLRHILATESATKMAKQAAALKDKPAVLPMPDGLDLRAHEHYDYVLVLSRSLTDWQNLLERFGLMDAATGKSNRKHPLGQGRAVWADKLLTHLDQHETERAEQVKRDAEMPELPEGT